MMVHKKIIQNPDLTTSIYMTEFIWHICPMSVKWNPSFKSYLKWYEFCNETEAIRLETWDEDMTVIVIFYVRMDGFVWFGVFV